MNNIYGNFVWWQGVVEDKMDPLMLGRCRVRILGYHTDDKNEIPTKDLPWATIMQPTTSAAISGIGTTPLGPVEGTWVVGFFRDGEDAQEPIIMGTIGGIPQKGADPQKGFNDPFGQYPKDDYLANEFREVPKDSHNYVPKAAEPDTNRLARGNLQIPTIDSTSLTDDSIPLSNGENSTSLKWKRKTRQEGVPKALAGDLSSSIGDELGKPFYMGTEIDEDVDNFNYYWNEPHPRYGGVKKSKTDFATEYSSCYPYNHVRQSESGHVEEWDDTPSVERLHRYHMSGTFEEIQADGTRIVKVVGNNYEIVAGDKNIVITSVKGANIDNGNLNITVEGDCRLLTMGSMVQEVRGNYHLNVLGDMRVKVGGNMVQEIMSARKIKVEKDDDLKVGKSKVVNVGINASYQIGKDFSNSAGSTWTATATNVGILATSGVFINGTATCDLLAAKVGIGSSVLTAIQSDVAITITAATELITITGPITETCAIKTSTAVGMWNRVGATILDTAVAHNCIDAAIFNVKAPLILLN